MAGAAPFDEHDAAALRRATALAERGRGEVEPNPMVGAVVYRGAETLAEGFHRAYGEAHAEVEALAALARLPDGASLAVTLEPCSSGGGGKKQPRCVDALVARRVRRVVAGEVDPDPRHRGAGLTALRAAGVGVVVAPPGSVPAALLAPLRAHLERDRPWVILKWAQGLDGRWDAPSPDERWISCEESRREVHRLRAHVDALLVGAGTVLADDPRLTARPPGPRPLLRVVVDGRARVAASAALFKTLDQGPILWVTGAAHKARTPDGPVGVERLELSSPHDLSGALLPALRRRGVARLLVEGGPAVAAAFLNGGVVDRAWVFVAPVVHGGRGEPGRSLTSAGASLDRAIRWNVESVERCGCDSWFKLSSP